MPVKPWPTAHPSLLLFLCLFESCRAPSRKAGKLCFSQFVAKFITWPEIGKKKRKRPKKAITNDVSFRATCLVTSSSRRSKREAIRGGERGTTNGERKREEEREEKEGKEKRGWSTFSGLDHPSRFDLSPTRERKEGRKDDQHECNYFFANI